jgi:hypothetical protein
MSHEIPPMWVTGNARPFTSSAVITKRSLSRRAAAATVWSVWRQPFGCDDVPDVWKIHRTGSPVGATQAGSPAGSPRGRPSPASTTVTGWSSPAIAAAAMAR